MKILVITSSPHKHGTSAYLAENFIKGATEAGHEVYRFDAAFKKVHPCTACNTCYNKGEGCVFKDDMDELNPHLFEADAVVFVSPIYYYNVSSQIKAVIDRFYANDRKLHNGRKTALLTTMEDETMESSDGANLCFRNAAKFLGWQIIGMVNARKAGTLDALMKTDYPEQAYELGKNI